MPFYHQSFVLAVLVLSISCTNSTNTPNEKLVETSQPTTLKADTKNGDQQKMPDWYFCSHDNCFEGNQPTQFKKINEQPSPQPSYVLDPAELSPNFKTTDKFIFATGILKEGTTKWLVLERAFIGNDFILSTYDASTDRKNVLFDQSSKPAGIANTPKPISWLDNHILIEDFKPDFAQKHHGIWKFNLTTSTLEKINVSSQYLTTPELSTDGRYLLYAGVTSKKPDYLHGNANQLLCYDLKLEQELVIAENDGIHVFGWSKKKSKVGTAVPKKSVLPGFKLPWASGIGRCTTRDGNVTPPAPIGSTTTCADLGNHGYIAHDFDTSNFSDEVITAVTDGIVTLANFSSASGGFSPSGYGNWVIVTHANNYRTLYAHLSRVDVAVGQSVSQGCVLGIEGTTGQSSGDHLHFEYETPGDINGNVYTTFDECNCVPRAGYVYSSANVVSTCGSGSSLDCTNSIPISCGVTYIGASSSASSNVTFYGCNSWTETGPERVHEVTATASGTLTATLTNFTGDLDVYILGSCDPNDCLGTVSSSSASFTGAQIGQTYYIVVDADDGSGSGYHLLVDCPTTSFNCSSAVALSCGVPYAGPSSSAASQVYGYGCNNWTETGPERIHTITPQGNGLLTATLSNFTGDLDVYILGSCDPDDCLGTVSASSASYANAVAGTTYYIVVDADDGSGSAYNLIVDCPQPLGLDCSNAVTLTCGSTYFGPSSNAPSAVETYGCNNWTESGPERIHKITPQASGSLTATLSNFSGDLDVYILGSCDPMDCLGTVSSSSATYANAQAGTTYYIVVDADDGSGSSYNLVVDCPEPVFTCSGAVTLTCGSTYFGPSSNTPSAVETYGCNNWTESGPERVHRITPTSNGTLTATLSNFTGDLDVYILGSCDPLDCVGTVSSSSATFANAQAGMTYYIVVDADDGSGSSYNLLVECPPPPNDCPPVRSLTSPIVSGVYEAYIQVNANAAQNNGTSVIFKGGDNVLLKDGFAVPVGATFEARIEDCQN